MLTITTEQTVSRPLDSLKIAAAGAGSFEVRDGQGRIYAELPADTEAELLIGGALGTQVVFHKGTDGRVLDQASFRVEAQSEIVDDGGRYKQLFDQLYDTMFQHWTCGYTKYLRIDGKRYMYFVSWLRDHVHALKGMKYFHDDLKVGIELYADSQREDGMIWDKCKEMCHSELQNYRDVEFADGDFVRPIPKNPTRRWMRIPVENDVEWLFLEGIYYTWKACGDDQWMAGLLDKAIKAVRYSTSDEYRWSEKFKLLKRGYTIDTWDFQSADDIKRSGKAMRVVPGKTEFNVFHGDNTGMAVGCKYLAEMLRVAGRAEEAEEFDAIGDGLKKRLDEVSWNGRFYTHMVPENPKVERDLGNTKTEEQTTLSNAYAINRRIDHEQCTAIIGRYQAIREEMPESSPGEWYNCYPIFDKGFKGPWNYMNGGVSTICAGELAHGAFEHGSEHYGPRILGRVIGLAEHCDGYLHNTFKGKMPDPHTATFTPVPIGWNANVDIHGETSDGEPAARWTGEGGNDMRNLPVGRQVFCEVEFAVNDPTQYKRKVVIGVSRKEPYLQSQTLHVDAEARSLYLLHTAQGSGLIGECIVHYMDGTRVTTYVETGKHLENWFMPAPDVVQGRNGRDKKPYRMGWQGANGEFENVGMFVWGWDNPHPGKRISHLQFRAMETSNVWFIAGLTLSDQAVQFPVDIVSGGIPDVWGAAAVMYALVEGLAGIVDTGKAYEQVRLSPRWAAAGVGEATACACYPASGGYLRYTYKQDGKTLQLAVSGNAEAIDGSLLLPAGASAKALTIDGQAVDIATEQVESSSYLKLPITGLGAHRVEVTLNG